MTMSSMNTAAAVAVGLLQFAACSSPTESPTRLADSAGSTSLVDVHFLISTRMETVEFTISDDGWAHCRVVGTDADRPVLDRFSEHVGAERVTELVQMAMDSGLAGFDPARMRNQLEAAGESAPYVIDGGSVFFRIRLDTAERDAGGDRQAATHAFVLDALDGYLLRFPDDRALVALHDITSMLEEIYWARRSTTRADPLAPSGPGQRTVQAHPE